MVDMDRPGPKGPDGVRMDHGTTKEVGADSVGVISTEQQMWSMEATCDFCGVAMTLGVPVNITLRNDPTPGLVRVVASYSFVRVSASTEHVCLNDAKDVDEIKGKAEEASCICSSNQPHCLVNHDTSQPTVLKAHFKGCNVHDTTGVCR